MSRIDVVETNLEFTHDLDERSYTQYLVVHHEASAGDMSAAEAHRYHIEHNGWAGIGYHYVIRFDGTVERGRPRDTVGAHAYGINGVSIGISLAGNWMDKEPYDAQVDSLEKLLADLCDIYGLDQDSIIGHRDVADILGDPSAATDCPGNCLYAKLGEIKSKVKEELA